MKKWFERLINKIVRDELRIAQSMEKIRTAQYIETASYQAGHPIAVRVDDAGHQVKGELEIVQYRDGLLRIQLIGEVDRDQVMRELQGYLFRNERQVLMPKVEQLIVRVFGTSDRVDNPPGNDSERPECVNRPKEIRGIEHEQ